MYIRKIVVETVFNVWPWAKPLVKLVKFSHSGSYESVVWSELG